MNMVRLKESGINYGEGLERFGGSVQLYEKYLNKLLSDRTYEDMREAALSGDIEAAFQSAHRLKSLIGNLSITRFYEEICALTEEFRAGVHRDYRGDFERMDLEIERIRTVIIENAG